MPLPRRTEPGVNLLLTCKAQLFRRASGADPCLSGESKMRVLPMGTWALLCAAAFCAGCVERPPVLIIPPPQPEVAKGPAPWRDVARDQDTLRLETIDAAWSVALAAARRARFAKAVEAEGALLDPKAALPRPETSPGRYECRLTR